MGGVLAFGGPPAPPTATARDVADTSIKPVDNKADGAFGFDENKREAHLDDSTKRLNKPRFSLCEAAAADGRPAQTKVPQT